MKTCTTAVVMLSAILLSPGVAPVGGQPQQQGRGGDLLVSAEWLAAHMTDPGLSILHVGVDRKSYEAGHVPGARFIPLSQLVVVAGGVPNELAPAADLLARLSALGIGTTGRVILYGDEKGLLAARAFFTLDYLGLDGRAALLDGGLERWRAEGRAISTDDRDVTPQPVDGHLRPDVLVMLPVVRDISSLLTAQKEKEWVLLDARPEAQYTGAEPGADIQRPGHIPGAVSLFWQRALVSPDNPVLRSEADLKKIFAEAGVTPGRTLVTYCRTGVQASFAYFVARYLGIPVRMYDGSFLEWSREADLPVATGKP